MRGKFITLEGCEGVGKSTQLNMLKDYLEMTGQPAIFTREPGGTPEAEAIRKIILDIDLCVSPRVEALLFAAARVSHIDNLLLPSINEGKLVISDRYLDSSFAYQGVARELGIDYVKEINKYAIENCLPDCTVFIDMDPEFSWRRQKGSVISGDRMENESILFHKKVYSGYDAVARLYPERIVRVIPDIDKTVTHQRILEALKSRGMIN
ncbi:MAG: Thymidylate kinase [Firmicutes bacterium ADurb.Bin080]|jgi:dTMP kinase|nr:dTMP kinase [Clostridiales bacterium]OQC15840.1 MAG: Thymidylate kinase [Firmicutes bacterium ADurb.Bin080]